jgi:predicted component of type VI protein secretion system
MAKGSLGLVRLERDDDGTVIISQHWNPHMLSFSDRQWIAGELEEIATLMRDNLFENEGKCVLYDLPNDPT